MVEGNTKQREIYDWLDLDRDRTTKEENKDELSWEEFMK